MVKVRVTKVYFDKKRDEYPEVGKEFDVEEKRAEVLVIAGVCEVVEDELPEEPVTAPTAKDTPQSETKKTSTKGAKKTTKKAEA